MREVFEEWAPQDRAISVLARATEIVEEYQAQDIILTLRQLYAMAEVKDREKAEKKELSDWLRARNA